MYTETVNIIAPAPRRLPATAAEAMAMYAIRKVETHEELVNLARLIHIEFDKIHTILDGVIEKLEAKRQEELAAQKQMEE